LFFGLTLHWFPVAGFGETFPQHVWYLFLPALTLALQLSAVLIRNLRGQIILTLRSDYVRTARAKGLFGGPLGEDKEAPQQGDDIIEESFAIHGLWPGLQFLNREDGMGVEEVVGVSVVAGRRNTGMVGC